MHPSAEINGKLFFEHYQEFFLNQNNTKIVDIGSQDVNGTLRGIAPAGFDYIGVDFSSDRGVDIVLNDPYTLPFESGSVDIVLSSSCFEHSEMFWLVYLEILRILKPHGLFYLNAPSNGAFHRYPVDCWRFYPDSGHALIKWARRNSINAVLLESYTSDQHADIWNDFVAVFLKDENFLSRHPRRILGTISDYSNGFINGSNEFLKFRSLPEDLVKLETLTQTVTGFFNEPT